MFWTPIFEGTFKFFLIYLELTYRFDTLFFNTPSLVPTERCQIIGCFEKISLHLFEMGEQKNRVFFKKFFNPLTNSHWERSIVHPELKKYLSTCLKWRRVFGGIFEKFSCHKKKKGLRKKSETWWMFNLSEQTIWLSTYEKNSLSTDVMQHLSEQTIFTPAG